MSSPARKLIGLATALAIWEAVSRLDVLDPRFLPPPSVVVARMVGLLGQRPFVLDLLATIVMSGGSRGIGLAILIAFPLGLLLGSVGVLRRAITPIVEFLRPIPSVALIPLSISVLGSGPGTKIALAVFASLWPILFNTSYALKDVDPQLIDTARSFRVRRWRIMTGVRLPFIAPFVLTGVRFSAAVALIVVISTELLVGASGGLGQFIYLQGSNAGRMDLVLAGTVLAGVFGYLVSAALGATQRRFFRWAGAGGSV